MIKLFELDKYFSKGKQNEIHVINKTTLDFPEKGLISITGPSGCGKTTLLNVIGGLDSFASGTVEIDGNLISKYKPLEWDVLRNKYIGYIFQNYNLLSDKTVYENIEVSLNMAGLYKKEEIEERINYVLEAVGMYNYRRRNVKALSGGQQQRVAIARALAKNPKVILADEPTGNLDANNTFEIMSIIKKISQTCLVILVSHERSMVDFYSDRVIELADGKVINDFDNSGAKTLEHTDERNIYLKDLNKDEPEEKSNVTRYYETEKDNSLAFNVIEVKDSIYIKVDTNSKKKIKFISDDTEIRLIDDHYKAKESEEALDYEFDMSTYETLNADENRKSFIRFKDVLVAGFKKVTGKRKVFGKLFLLAYFVISALVVYQIATFANLLKIDEKDFVVTSKELITVTADTPLLKSDFTNILNNVEGVELSPYTEKVSVNFVYEDFYQGKAESSVSAYPTKASWYPDLVLKYGEMPSNNKEIVVDKWLLETILKDKEFSDLGVNDFESFIGMQIFPSYSETQYLFTIVGICETDSPVFILDDSAIYSFLPWLNYLTVDSMEGRYTIYEGDEIDGEYEILSYYTNESTDIGDIITSNGHDYTVVGKFIEKSGEFHRNSFIQTFIANESFLQENLLNRIAEAAYFGEYFYYYDTKPGIYFYSDDMEQAIEDIQDLDSDYTAVNSYESLKTEAMAKNREEINQRIQSVFITLAGIVVYIFFMMRSSMLNRIKEIGIYRSIGATKRDIYKIFLGEILSFTTLGSVTGYLIMSYLIIQVQNTVGTTMEFFYLPFHYFIGGLVGLYLINIVFGLLPVFSLLRKTPSEINAKFDI